MIKAVLFDMDGVCFDTERMYHDVWIEVGARQGLVMTEQLLTDMRGRNQQGCDAVCRASFGPDFDFYALREVCVSEMEARIARDGLPHKEGLGELLQELAARGIPAVLATSTSRETSMRYLNMAGVKQYFAGAVCGDDVSHSKPHPEVFLKAAALAGAEPASCLVLEDSVNGVKAGAAAGCVTVMVPDMTPADDELRAIASHVLPSLTEVKNRLDTF